MTNPFLSRLLAASVHELTFIRPDDAVQRLRAGFSVTGYDGQEYQFTADRTFKHLAMDHIGPEAHLRLIRLDWAVKTVIEPWQVNDYVERGFRPNGKTQWQRPCKAFVGLFKQDYADEKREAMLVRAIQANTGLIVTYHTITPLAKAEEFLDEQETAHHPHGTGYTVTYRNFEPKILKRRTMRSGEEG